jgi:hypothetical protein
MEHTYNPAPNAVPMNTLSRGDRFRYSHETPVYLVVARTVCQRLYSLNTEDHLLQPVDDTLVEVVESP